MRTISFDNFMLVERMKHISPQLITSNWMLMPLKCSSVGKRKTRKRDKEAGWAIQLGTKCASAGSLGSRLSLYCFWKANLQRCMNATIQADMMPLLLLCSLYTIKEALHFKLRGRWRCVYTCGVSRHKTFLNPRRPQIEKLLRALCWSPGTNIWFAFTASLQADESDGLRSRSSESEKCCSKNQHICCFHTCLFLGKWHEKICRN